MHHILIVDDEEDALEFLAEEFIDRGFEVDTALNGRIALEKIGTNPPDIMLLDMRMPGMDGIAVLRKIREIAPNLKVIMLTAIQDEEVVEQAMALGAADYVRKPITLEYIDNVLIGKFLKSADGGEG